MEFDFYNLEIKNLFKTNFFTRNLFKSKKKINEKTVKIFL